MFLFFKKRQLYFAQKPKFPSQDNVFFFLIKFKICLDWFYARSKFSKKYLNTLCRVTVDWCSKTQLLRCKTETFGRGYACVIGVHGTKNSFLSFVIQCEQLFITFFFQVLMCISDRNVLQVTDSNILPKVESNTGIGSI